LISTQTNSVTLFSQIEIHVGVCLTERSVRKMTDVWGGNQLQMIVLFILLLFYFCTLFNSMQFVQGNSTLCRPVFSAILWRMQQLLRS